MFRRVSAQGQEQIAVRNRQNLAAAERLPLHPRPERVVIDGETVKRCEKGLMQLDQARIVRRREVQLVAGAEVRPLLRRAGWQVGVVPVLDHQVRGPEDVLAPNQDIKIN